MPALDVDFHDDRISMLYWYPRIETLDVPLPETGFFNIENTETTFDIRDGDDSIESDEVSVDGVDMGGLLQTLENIPVEDIQALIEDLPSEKAHIRSDWKASRLAGGEGRALTTDPRRIHEQVMQLIDSMAMTGFPHRSLVVREWIDVDELAESYAASICPEVRFIVDEGEVLDGFVDVYEDDFDNSFTDEEAAAVLEDLEARLDADYDKLSSWAGTVAEELDDTGWSVDFVQDTDGNWYITDMALYGLYWSDDKDCWHNISHIPSGKPYNLEETIPESLPETKE